MIIACPNCTQPYQLPDDQVAPLVQVQCAHCDYRVILDFEAANDPSLREPGMLLADGFRSEEDYNSALADGHSVSQHELPAPPPKPVVAKPTAPRTSPPATAQTTQSAASRPAPIPQPTTRPKSGGLVSGLGLSDTPGSLAAAVTEHDRTEPEPEVQAEPPKAAEPEVKVKAPEPEPEVKAPEPEVKAPEPEPEPEVKAPEPEVKVKAPEPEVTKTPEKAPEKTPEKVKDAEPEKAAATPAAEEEGKGSGPFWIILIVLVILIFVVTYATTGQFNPAQLLQPSGK